jgi:Fe-S oxidoreductase
MDLCLECKGCKAECDAGVDMAKLKSEFLYKYNQKHGISLRTRLFTNIDALNRIGSRFSSFLNIACNNFLVKSMLHIFLGIHSARTLPYLAKQGLPEWFKSRQEPSVSFPNGKVVLFNDTFISYNYPEVGKSAVRVLERAGYEVILASIGEKGVQGISCCGRPFISKGLLDKAVSNARHNVDLLYEYVRQGFPIIGCEPSCVLALKDEYVGLINDQKAKEVAQSTYLIDEFLISLHKRGQLDLGSSRVAKKVLFFGHCHQKAHSGTKYSTDLLELLPGVQVKELVAGCCGMAGAFGYEKEHYDISMSIGRQKVFPAIESMDADWEIATMGISCRQQIEHGTGRKVRHLMEIFEEGLY